MKYAEVAVDAPVGYDRTFTYSIPPALSIVPGQLVWVPFGSRPVQGIVCQLTDQPQVESTKDILSALEPSPLVTPRDIKLARWISRYYRSSLFDALALMLPPGFKNRVKSYIQQAPLGGEALPPLRPKAQAAVDYISRIGRVREVELKRVLGKDSEKEISWLTRKGLLRRTWELPRPRLSYRYDCYIRLVMDKEHLKSARQKVLLETLALSGNSVPLSLANKEYGSDAVTGLFEKGLVSMEWIRIERTPALGQGMRNEDRELRDERLITLTYEQERALSEITAALANPDHGPKSFLLYGVTGSGKTEVYLRALERCVENGRQGIYLVPEIALTPQTVHYLNVRFAGKIAVMHSELPEGQQSDQWWRIREGAYDVVIGPRSAVFAPLTDPGLIIIDEEHEWTYKQHEQPPYYHTRDVALKLAELAGAVVVMGSATPDVETYYKAQRGEHKLLELPRRVTTYKAQGTRNTLQVDTGLPGVEICDMRMELTKGNRSIFSQALIEALKSCLSRNQQAILFLNRRGAATVVQCRECGFTLRCRSCAVAMTYHRVGAYGPAPSLLCHQCNRRMRVPGTCTQCGSQRIRYLGIGTQRVVEELARLLPDVPVQRWDRDAAREDESYEVMLSKFVQGDTQILVGTQMVAKGLHVPSVTLVCAILADIGLNLPDFRAGERTFQLLCQVAGRAGRGASGGRVIIQTYDPDNYAIKAASYLDYKLFYDKEIQHRRQHGNPPFNQLIHMLYLHINREACQRESENMDRRLRHKIATLGLTDVELVGPAPAFPERVRGKYRWHIIIRGRDLHTFLEGLSIPQGWMVDVDPVSVL